MQTGDNIRIIVKTKILKLNLGKNRAGSKAAKNSHGLKATAKIINKVPEKNITISLVFSNLLENKISPNPRI
jgi:hypothetical protein